MNGSEEVRICLHCLVSGKVQGVFYRAAAREQAARLGVTGWARNRADGSVELLACGERDAVRQFQDWLRAGPPQARVSSVACEPADYQPLGDFLVERG